MAHGSPICSHNSPEPQSAPGVNAGDVLAAILISSPVLGLRPVRALRSRGLKEPKPGTTTSLPAATLDTIASSSASTARVVSCCLLSCFVFVCLAYGVVLRLVLFVSGLVVVFVLCWKRRGCGRADWN